MVLNTISVGAAVTPTVVKTYGSHYLNRKPRAQKPTAHISYDEGLNLIRQFLEYASHHTVEEIQAFTAQWVPSPRWVRCEDVTISEKEREGAAEAIIAQLGHRGVDTVGGKTWWQWRRDNRPLKAEWIEMRSDYAARKKSGAKCARVMLYVHGGAYFFGSVDEHRYQMQRHARKLKARVLAPRYRLAPQFPFPCGLHDCLAAYLHLLTVQDPSTIILSGDSAGGGMVVSMLAILRDQGIPLPAGAILISPWVDLTHSFPSVAGESKLDYIPPHGFMQRPSAAWPPPNSDDMKDMAMHAVEQLADVALPRKSTHVERKQAHDAAIQGFTVDSDPKNLHPVQNINNPAGQEGVGERPGNTIPGPGHDLSIMIDGKLVEIKDQIQMYANNNLISHPLVSPILQPTLGGLPPLLILTGGAEMLRDEQIYLAHKAANPAKYPPGEAYLNAYPEARELIHKHKPTDVQLQVWDDLCHVAPTLSFTRPAKYMYRSIAQFGAWALARSQKTDIEIMDDDDVSVISSGSDTESESPDVSRPKQQEQLRTDGQTSGGAVSKDQVGKAGDSLPPFRNHMIRQRVDRHGAIFPLEPSHTLAALQMPANDVGVIKPGPVRRWMAAKLEWDTKYAKEKRRVQKQRVKEMAKGYQGFGNDEVPPPSALAGRRGASMPKEHKIGRSWGMSLWSLWGSSHDKNTIEREEKADKEPETSTATEAHGASTTTTGPAQKSRSRSRRRTVSDQGQANGQQGDMDEIDENTSAVELQQLRGTHGAAADRGFLSPTFVPLQRPSASTPSDTFGPSSQQPLGALGGMGGADIDGAPVLQGPPGGNQPLVLEGTNVTLDSMNATRPKADGIAFPFKLGKALGGNEEANASTVTLASGMVSPAAVEGSEDWVGAKGSKVAERPGVERFETAREEI